MAKDKKITSEEKADYTPRGYEDTFDMSANDLEALSSQIKKDLIEAEDDKTEWLQERVKDVNAYFGIKKQTDWPFKGAAKVSSQMHRVMVDTMAANLVSSALAPQNVLEVKTNKSQSIENAKYVGDIHNNLARFEYHLQEVLDRSWHTALIESYVVLKPVYIDEIMETAHSVTRWIPKGYASADVRYDSDTDTVLDGQGGVIPSLDIARIPEDPEELKALDLEECRIDVIKEHRKEGTRVLSISGEHIFVPKFVPGETPFEKYQRSPYVIEDEFKTLQEMEMLVEQKKIKNYEVMRGVMSENLVAEELRNIKEQQGGGFDLTDQERHITRNLWWYGKFPYKGKLRELVVYMNYESGVILKVMVNQFGIRPYFPQMPFPIEGTTLAESLPKMIRPLVAELELAMNTVINMGLIKAYPPKFFDPLGGLDPKTLGNFGPNAYIPVRDPSRNVFMPPQPEDPRILMEMVKMIMDLIERTTANSDAVQGQVSPTANTTAFEVQQSLVRAGVRFDIIYKRLKAQLEPMFEYIHKLNLRFMPLEKEIAIMGQEAVLQGEDGSESSRLQKIYEMEGCHGISLTGNSLTEEQQELQKAKELFALFAQDPYISYKPESPYYLRFNLVKHYNPVMMDQLLPKPDEVKKLLRDRQNVQNEQEQKAVEEGKQHSDPSAQMQAQAMQMELQIKAQEAQLNAQAKQHQMEMDLQKQQADMQMKEREHDQKMRQMEEAHKLKMELMRKESDAKAKEKPNVNKKS